MKPIAWKQAARMAWLAAAALLVIAAPTLASAETPSTSVWSRFWQTPDQLGQSLLKNGDAAGAAQAFADPEHKAHAALQAGDYAGAAQTLNGIDKTDAHYNRGNALAHAGDLQGAIQAYDAALKHNPSHSDARHNRDVVAAALQKQKDDKKEGGQKDKQDKQDKDDSNKRDGKGGKPDNKPGDGKDGKPDEKPGDSAGQKPGDKSDKQASDKPDEQPASAPQSGKASAAPAAQASAAKDDADQARRDAESALGKGTQRPPAAAQNGASTPAQAMVGANDAVKPKPLTEKQIAQEQWLRAIPDDPGGLLRRKFLIEHMLRQQGQKP